LTLDTFIKHNHLRCKHSSLRESWMHQC